MRKLLRNRDLIMIAASLLGDSIIDFIHVGEETRKRRDIVPMIIGSSHPSSLGRSVNRLLKTNELEKFIKGGQPYLRLTNSGKEAFFRDFPLFKFQAKQWDGYWTVVSYDIPEKNRLTREYLCNKLQRLGFGMLQKSSYISPHDFGEDVREWIASNDLIEYVSVSKSKELAPDERKLAKQVFNLDVLEDRYLDIFAKITKVEEQGIPENVRHEYLQLLLTDPLLPAELLPVDWPEYKIRRLVLLN